MFTIFGIVFTFFQKASLFSSILFTVKFLVEILKLTEASLAGDRQKAQAYARQLAEKLEVSGEAKAAERLKRVLAGSGGPTITSAGLQERVPVDSESRLSLADETWVEAEEAIVFLRPEAERSVQEFLTYVEASDKLIAEGVGVSASMLMYGPPGCGKTELARYIAARLGIPLITSRADTLVSSYLGSTSKNLRLLFDHISSRPCVLFLDEFDAIAKLRDDRHELGELKRVVVSLLQNIDAARNHSVMLAATNHEHLLDPAIWRRFSYRVKVDYPDANGRASMFRLFLAGSFPERSLKRLSEASEGMTGSDIREICEGARRSAILRGDLQPKEPDILLRILLRRIDGEALSIPELVMRAKSENASVFTHRVLADALGMSPGNVTRILKKQEVMAQ